MRAPIGSARSTRERRHARAVHPPTADGGLPAAERAQPAAGTSRPQDPAEREAGRLAHEFATCGVSVSAGGASGNIRPPFTGAQLPDGTRRRFEGFFRADLSGVRLFADSGSAAAARQLNTGAFTVGQTIHFAEHAYDEHTHHGARLLAHELAHTIQARRGPDGASATIRRSPDPPPIGPMASVSPHDQRLNQEFESWNRAIAEYDEADDHHDAAYAFRIVLMLQGVTGDRFPDDAALDAFLEGVQRDALDEAATLRNTGEWALGATKAFPLIWSGRVFDALHLDVDTTAMEQQRLQSQRDMLIVADRVPAFVADVGLPVPYAEALTLSAFDLELRHVNLPLDHVVKDMALAARTYAAEGWAAGFYAVWNGMAETFAERVADGELVVDFKDYTEFVATRQAGLQALVERIGAINADEGLAAFDGDVVSLTHAAFVSAFASTLVGFVPALLLWHEGSTLFAEKLKQADAIIAADSAVNKILRAIQWAWEGSYFSAAGAELVRNILAHGWKIVGMAVGFIIVQQIPFLNVAVDLAVLVYSGQDAVRALYELYQTFATVSAAPTVVALQRASAQMAGSMEGNGLRVLLDLLAISSAAKGIRARADALRSGGMSEEEALRQAMKEATGEEAAALRSAAARQRITARFDPNGVLNGVLDRGVSAEVVEQALMSGMKPQRLNSIVADIADAARAEELIRYAGNYSSPVNRLLGAGVPVSRVGDLVDLGFGLRELRACELLLQRTGRTAAVDGFIGTLAEFGAERGRAADAAHARGTGQRIPGRRRRGAGYRARHHSAGAGRPAGRIRRLGSVHHRPAEQAGP